MTERGNGAATEPPPRADAEPPQADTLDLRARLDRFGEIIAKGLDLAEAGMSLGLTIISTVGAAAQTKIFEKMMDSVAPDTAPPDAVRSSAAAPAASAAPAGFGIVNRLPLAPGAPFRISFSVNNDSADAPRHVTLAVEPFTGEATGALLPPALMEVMPAAAAIAPMDFEKFVLQGAIPPSTPPDTYRGHVAVHAESTMRIPVLLVVEPGGGA